MTGMYNLEILRASHILAFNKRLVNEAGYDYPYQLVLDGKWTYDRFVEMVASATRDLNGDTIIDPNVDQFGYWGWVWESVPSLYMALGGDVITKDKDNMPVISIETERNIAIVEKMNELFAMDGAAYETVTYGTFDAAFKNGTLMFDHSSLGDIQNMRDMKDDFGFVPYPKFDEVQEGYNVRVGKLRGAQLYPGDEHETGAHRSGARGNVRGFLQYGCTGVFRRRADGQDSARHRVGAGDTDNQ